MNIDELKEMDNTELSSTLNVDISQVEEARKHRGKMVDRHDVSISVLYAVCF
jgi:hypothetical protein